MNDLSDEHAFGLIEEAGIRLALDGGSPDDAVAETLHRLSVYLAKTDGDGLIRRHELQTAVNRKLAMLVAQESWIGDAAANPMFAVRVAFLRSVSAALSRLRASPADHGTERATAPSDKSMFDVFVRRLKSEG